MQHDIFFRNGGAGVVCMDAFKSPQFWYNSEYIQTKSIISVHFACEFRRMFAVPTSTKRCTLFPYVKYYKVMIM